MPGNGWPVRRSQGLILKYTKLMRYRNRCKHHPCMVRLLMLTLLARLLVAPKKYCTDNAVMVASLAYYKYQAGLFADMTLEPKATG